MPDTKPRAVTPFARWQFHLKSVGGCAYDKKVYQIGPGLTDVVSQVLPYLQWCVAAAAGRDRVDVRAVPPVTPVLPGSFGEPMPYSLNNARRPMCADDDELRAGGLDLCDLFMAYWEEVRPDLDGPFRVLRGCAGRCFPAYEWDVWYGSGVETEAAFRHNDAGGNAVPEFTVGRVALDRLGDLIGAPDFLERGIFRL